MKTRRKELMPDMVGIAVGEKLSSHELQWIFHTCSNILDHLSSETGCEWVHEGSPSYIFMLIRFLFQEHSRPLQTNQICLTSTFLFTQHATGQCNYSETGYHIRGAGSDPWSIFCLNSHASWSSFSKCADSLQNPNDWNLWEEQGKNYFWAFKDSILSNSILVKAVQI